MLGANTDKLPRPLLANARNSSDMADPTAYHKVSLKAAAVAMGCGKIVVVTPEAQVMPWPQRTP